MYSSLFLDDFFFCSFHRTPILTIIETQKKGIHVYFIAKWRRNAIYEKR